MIINHKVVTKDLLAAPFFYCVFKRKTRAAVLHFLGQDRTSPLSSSVKVSVQACDIGSVRTSSLPGNPSLLVCFISWSYFLLMSVLALSHLGRSPKAAKRLQFFFTAYGGTRIYRGLSKRYSQNAELLSKKNLTERRHNMNPLLLCVRLKLCVWAHCLALAVGGLPLKNCVTPGAHAVTFPCLLPHPRVQWLWKQSCWNPSKLVLADSSLI